MYSDQAQLDHNSVMSDWHYRAHRFPLYLGWESEAFSSVPSPMVTKLSEPFKISCLNRNFL